MSNYKIVYNGLRDSSQVDDPSELSAAEQLCDLMSDISEECMCASWLMDLEYILWSVVKYGAPREFGMGNVSEENVAQLRALSEKAGGWIVWGDEDPYATFMPMPEWELRYRARCVHTVR